MTHITRKAETYSLQYVQILLQPRAFLDPRYS